MGENVMSIQAMAFEIEWRSLQTSHPALYELVVTKTSDGVLAWDWLEPSSNSSFFAEPEGVPTHWMPANIFNWLAPFAGVSQHLMSPVSVEANAKRLLNEQALRCDAEPISEALPRYCTRMVPSKTDLAKIVTPEVYFPIFELF